MTENTRTHTKEAGNSECRAQAPKCLRPLEQEALCSPAQRSAGARPGLAGSLRDLELDLKLLNPCGSSQNQGVFALKCPKVNT